jgi:hypothetical protein
LVPLFLFLLSLQGKRAANWKTGLLVAAGGTLVLWIFSVVLGVIASQTDAGRQFITDQGLTTTWDVLGAATLLRLKYGAGLLTLVLLIGPALAYLAGLVPDGTDTHPEQPEQESSVEHGMSIPFVLMLVLFGGLLVLAPEFVYLRDQFGSRMNTVFKFYYQAWALWSLAAAFGIVVLINELRGIKLILFSGAMIVVLGIGLTYPVLALPEKTENFYAANSARRTLDGAAHLNTGNPDFGRVSTYSGQPSVLGWPGHESQWRGGYAEMGNRKDDLARLYATANWEEAQAIIAQYGIRYIYIGQLERTTYPVNEFKFSSNLSEAYRQGTVVIYQVP